MQPQTDTVPEVHICKSIYGMGDMRTCQTHTFSERQDKENGGFDMYGSRMI